MKVVAYGIQPSEKGILAQANHKKHDITLIANALSEKTAFYAQGKQAVIVFSGLEVSSATLQLLAELGIKYLIHHSKTVSFSGENAKKYGITWANITLSSYMVGVPHDALLQATEQTIFLLDEWHALETN
ncbi:hypothetical protein [Rufibacter sp. DG15C]|uniref:hypothetical protein n=1 Tax=Rufibacter sp. DG15C TaxID=1379909 RepID=UPI00082DFC99|nr:hypothetical protein [Rufibacter sp. DG15C]